MKNILNVFKCLLLLVFTMAATTLTAQNVKVSIDSKGKTLEQILPEITKQTGIQFTYDTEILKTKVQVEHIRMEASLEKVLDRTFSGTNIIYTISNNRVNLTVDPSKTSTTTQAGNTKTISGTVLSEEDMEPVIGAAIQVTGSPNIGAVTNIDGKFTLTNVPASAKTVTITYIGMQTEVADIKNNLQIILKPNVHTLDEVLVVAFGEMKRSAFTGSAGVVSTEAIAQRQVTNAMEAIGGQIAGVQMIKSSGGPDASPSFRIRGISSINAGNSPLIIVDGAPYSSTINSINPNDIESLTVLKDAASNALYGARGANGVVMITTKKAATGKARISFDMKFGVNTRVNDSYDYIKDPRQYYEVHYKALYNYYAANGYTPGEAHAKANETIPKAQIDGGLGYQIFDVPEGQYLIGSNGKFNPNASYGRIVEHKGKSYMLQPDNWIDEAYKTGIRQEYNISFNGGDEKMQMYASFGYLKNEGIVENSDFERYSARMKSTYQLKKWLRFGGNVNFTAYDSNSANESIFSSIVGIAPIYPLYIRDQYGNIMHNEHGKVYDYGEGSIIGLERPVLINTNPLQTNQLNTSNSNVNTFNGSAFTDINFLNDFKATINISAMNADSRGTSTSQPFYGYVTAGGQVSKSHSRRFNLNFQQLLNYNKTFGEHTVSAMAGHEFYRERYYTLSGSKTNMFSYFENQELSGATKINSTNSYTEEYQTEGYFTRVMYDYQNKYFFSGSYRRDASSRFHPSHRWGNFWSLSGAWMLHEENWFNVPWVNTLKVKASYGSQGNDNIGDYRYEDTYSLEGTDDLAIIFNDKGNENITWETNGTFNTGIEFDLFKGKLSGEVEYFHRKTTNMLSRISLPYSVGYGSFYDNIGDMVNQGIEISLNSNIIKNKNITWSAHLNATHFKNKITRLADERKSSTLEGKPGYYSGDYFYGEGASMYTWRMPKFAGINEEGRSTYYVTDKNTGELKTTTLYSSATDYNRGDAIPTLYGGFGTSLRYKGFDLSVSFSYSLGGKALDSGYRSSLSIPGISSTGSNFHKDVLKSWTPENPTNDFARWQFDDKDSNSKSDRFLMDASWLNFNNASLGYTLPGKIAQRLDISRLRIYVTCDNIAFFSKRQGFDPSRSWNGSTSASRYSPIRSISGGINIQF